MNKLNPLLIAAPALAALSPLAVQAGKAQTRPNVVFLIFDDLGYGDLGCYGQQKIETPNIDALASHGLRFTDMYSCAPLSSPSRCCLYTGQHMGHAQVRNNYSVSPDGWNHKDLYSVQQLEDDSTREGQYPLAPGTQTIGTLMQKAGYKTAMVGKWGIGNPGSGSLANDMGFDYFFGYVCQRLAHFYYPHHLWENGRKVELPNAVMEENVPLDAGADPKDANAYDKYEQQAYSPDVMFARMADFVDKNADASGKNPFFLMWTTTVPHSCVQAPKNEVMHYVEKLGDEEPVKGEGYLPSRYPHATYAAMVTHIDTQVGKMVQKLKDLGIYDNTIIIVTSDNGPACNSNSPMEYFESGGPFRCRKGWGKSSIHEGGIRMPFIVSWGDRYKAQDVTRMSSFSDIMPTLSELVGVKAVKNDGISLLPTIEGDAKKQKDHKSLYWEFSGAQGWVAVRIGLWKGILKGIDKGNKTLELFNLKTDPREDCDVAAQHPDIVKQMWAVAKREHQKSQNPLFQMEIPFPEDD